MAKKKKKQGSTGLIVAAAAAGGLLLVGGIVLAVVLRGGAKKKEIQAKPDQVPGPLIILKPEKRKVGLIARRMEVPEVLNLFRQMGLAYQERLTLGTKGPANLKELGPELANSKLNEWLTNGWITVVWGARLNNLPNGTSGTALAWENDSDSSGRRVVLMCDGSVHELDDDSFAKTPKASGP